MTQGFKLLQNRKNLVNGLKGIIPGEISLKDFSAVTNFDIKTSQKIIDEYLKFGIGIKKANSFEFDISDKLRVAIHLLEQGAPLDEIAQSLDWKNFEGLVSKILESKNFGTITNLILTKPRMEIDVVGIRLGVALLIDCKHWNYSSPSNLSMAVKKQIERTKNYVAKTPGAIAVPVIVSLHSNKVNFIEKVPIVPIFQFSQFVDEFYGNLDQMKSIRKG